MRYIHGRKWRWIWLLLLVIAGVFGWWRVSQPKHLVLVARHQLARLPSNISVFRRALDAGVLWHDAQGTVHATRWDGTPLWALGGDNSQVVIRDSVVSPDLRWVALLDEREVSTPYLWIWHDGQLKGKVKLPVLGSYRGFRLVSDIDNDGVVWCLTATQLLHIKNAHIVARGRLPVSSDKVLWTLPRDGGALAGIVDDGWTYYTASVVGVTVRFRKTYTTKIPPWSADGYWKFRLLKHDTLILEDGTRFNAQGQMAGSDGWSYDFATLQDQCRTFSGVLVKTRGAVSRVQVLATGQDWTIPEENATVAGVTPDGRYAMTTRDFSSWDYLAPIVKRWPTLDEKRVRAQTRELLSIYERPGRLRARMITKESRTHGGEYLPGMPQPLVLCREGVDTAFSPDGKTLHVLAEYQDGDTTGIDILSYRW